MREVPLLKKLLLHTALIFGLSAILAVSVHFPLIIKYFRGEFRQGFISYEEFPGIRFITLAEAEDLFATQRALFIDSRSRSDYKSQHIPGAWNIPFEENKEGLNSEMLFAPIDKTLVIYCAGGDCQESIGLAKLIHRLGYRDIRVFSGGWTEWRAARLPVEEGK